ncbi:MAG TPA: hypothetical protein VFR09_06345 [Alphaproteobacteria bacterium]|nr:hypothetical protein [Alphaproteobacteria bacterium]
MVPGPVLIPGAIAPLLSDDELVELVAGAVVVVVEVVVCGC